MARHTGQQEGEALAVEEIGNASPEGQHDPNPSQGLEQNAISISTIYFISVLLPHYLYFDVCKSDETPPPERLRPRFFVDIFFASSLAKVSENPRAES